MRRFFSIPRPRSLTTIWRRLAQPIAKNTLGLPRLLPGMRNYNMIGMSLDTLPFELLRPTGLTWGTLDTDNDFLAPMSSYCVRVGALSPQDNDNVRKMVAKLPRRRMTLTVQNRFIEHVLERS